MKKIIENIVWLIGDKFIRLGLGLFVGAWTARYLGAQNFGIINYAVSLITLLGSITALGLPEIVVRNIAANQHNKAHILGTALTAQFISGAALTILLLFYIYNLSSYSRTEQLALTIISLLLVIRPSEIYQYWFEATVQSKFTVLAQNTHFLIFSVIKVLMITNELPVIYFIYIIVLEPLLVNITGLALMNVKGIRLMDLRFKLSTFEEMFLAAWPLLLASVFVEVYMKIDQVMIGQLLGMTEVGDYAASSKVVALTYFLPIVVSNSVFPSMIVNRTQNRIKYMQDIQRILTAFIYSSTFVAAAVTMFSEDIIYIIYGSEFKNSAKLLVFQIWALPFVSMGILSGKFLLAEELQKISMQRSLMGAIVNMILNYLLIPKYGTHGAAVATLISFSVASFWADILNKETRPMFFMKIFAIDVRKLKTVRLT